MDKHAFSHAAYCTAIVWGNIFTYMPDWLQGLLSAIYGANFVFWMLWMWLKLLMDFTPWPLSHRPTTTRLILLNLIVPLRIFWRP